MCALKAHVRKIHNNNIYIFPPKSNSNEEKKNKNFIPGQKQFRNLKRTFLTGQKVVSKKKKSWSKGDVKRTMPHDFMESCAMAHFFYFCQYNNINNMTFSLDCGTL